MEKLDKEALALKKYPPYIVEDSGTEWDINKQKRIDFIKEMKVVENHYLKLIEEKDKTISHLHIATKGLNTMFEECQKEILQAKDLLKEGLKTKQFYINFRAKVEEFLNK